MGETGSSGFPRESREVETLVRCVLQFPVDKTLSRLRVEWRLQIAAVIRQDGKLEGISLLRHIDPATEQAVIQDLESWEFKPATHGGVPVHVDAVIEIPFILPAEVAKRAQP